MAETAKEHEMMLSPEMASFLRDRIQEGVSSVIEEKDAEINDLNARIVSLTEEKSDNESMIEAAEQLIESLSKKVVELSANGENDDVLETRHEAALKLLDEAILRLLNHGIVERKLEAATSLLTSSLENQYDNMISMYADEQMGDLDESIRDSIRPLIENCDDTSSVDNVIESVMSMARSNKRIVREPLPTRNRGTLTEDFNDNGNSSGVTGDYITDTILAKVSR